MWCYQCNHSSDTCKFYKFPKRIEERTKWMKCLLKKDPPPSESAMLCVCHFINGDKKQIIDMHRIPAEKLKEHIKSVFKKIKTKNTTEFVEKCIKLELIDDVLDVKNDGLGTDCVNESIKLEFSGVAVDFKNERLSTENVETNLDFLHVDIKCEKVNSEDNI